MVEEEKTETKEEVKEEIKPDTAENTSEGNESKTNDEVEKINADTERINKAIAENENAKARQRLGGITEAGKAPEKPKEETPQEYAERVIQGGFKLDG